LGSMVGEGRGSALATLAGGLGGAYVGSQAAKANASELSVKLDDGRNIVVFNEVWIFFCPRVREKRDHSLTDTKGKKDKNFPIAASPE